MQDGIGYRDGEPVITLHMEAYLGAPESYDAVEITGSPALKMKIAGGVHGDIATASIVVNSLPKILEVRARPAHDARHADPVVLRRESLAVGDRRWSGSGRADVRPVTHPGAHGRSPTPALLFGLIITLATVVAYSGYITSQVSGLRRLQSDLVDRNRRDSLLLLRIQDDLNQLGLAMRDMLDSDGPYPLTAWSAQFDRIRVDLDDALRREEEAGAGRRTPEQARYLANSVAQFWDAAGRIFDLARAGQEDEARAQIRLSLQARQAALSTAVARLLVQNNESEERTAQQVQEIYGQVHRQVYWFLTATLAAIAATSLYLIRSNRRLFARLASLSDQRRELAQQLIATRESTLHEISRELHDQFGQILTAMGSMLGRAEKHAPEGSSLRTDLREIGEIAQATLDNVRGLSQTLHPSILDELGLESTHRLVSVNRRKAARHPRVVRAFRRGRAGRRHHGHSRLPRPAGGDEQYRAAFGHGSGSCAAAFRSRYTGARSRRSWQRAGGKTGTPGPRPRGDARAGRAARRHDRVSASGRRRHSCAVASDRWAR